MGNRRSNNFWKFLKDTQFIFATWGIIGAISIYLLEFYWNNLTMIEELRKTNVTTSENISIQLILGNFMFPFAISSIFIIFLLISTLIAWKAFTNIPLIKRHEDKMTLFNVIAYMIFIVFFLVFIITLSVYMILAFFSIFTVFTAFIEIIGIIAILAFIVGSKQLLKKNPLLQEQNPNP